MQIQQFYDQDTELLLPMNATCWHDQPSSANHLSDNNSSQIEIEVPLRLSSEIFLSYPYWKIIDLLEQMIRLTYNLPLVNFQAHSQKTHPDPEKGYGF